MRKFFAGAMLALLSTAVQAQPNLPAQVNSPYVGNGIGSANSLQFVPSFTVATLPTCNATTVGKLLAVSDASAPAYNATLTGGGAVYTLALCNGSVWVAH